MTYGKGSVADLFPMSEREKVDLESVLPEGHKWVLEGLDHEGDIR